ncbi:MAG: ABC-2 transporter permease [Lachnospiraceae bacterium]|nr:ABC-2 transporter permease [Lachnospiraceae bacterium]
MKGFILNDLYHISNMIKQTLLIVVVWGFAFANGSGSGAYMPMFTILFCMMGMATVFATDEKCGWMKYAMIFPVSKRDYVLAKYIVNFIFALSGCLTGIVLTVLVNQVREVAMKESMYLRSLIAVGIGMIFGSVFIPLMIKYGTEKARIILLGIVMIPVLLGYFLQRLLEDMRIEIAVDLLERGVYLLPAAAILLTVVTYVISARIFERREF